MTKFSDQVLDLWLAGKSREQIAKDLKSTEGLVRGIVRDAKAAGDQRTIDRKAPSKGPLGIRFNAERDDRILDLWQAGHSGGEIGMTLKLSRSAVIGVVSRARAAGDARAERKERNRKSSLQSGYHGRPRVPRIAKPKTPKAKKPKTKSGVKPPRIRVIAIAPGAAPSLNLRLTDLPDKGACKFSTTPHDTTEHRFCGHPAKEGEPYCPAHRAIAWNGLPKKKDRQEDPGFVFGRAA